MTVLRIMLLLAFAVSVNGSPAASEDTIAIIQTRVQDFDTKAEEIPPASSRYPGTGFVGTDAWGPPEPLWGQPDPFSGELPKEVDWRLVAWASVGTDKDCSPSHGADLSCADAGRVCGSGDTASCCPYTDGSAMLEVTEAACKEKCAGLKQCTHVLYDANAKKCAFRENVHVGSCVTGTYTIYQKNKYQYDDANVCRKNCPTASYADAGITDETFVGSYDFLNVMKNRCNESPTCTGFQFHSRPGSGWGKGWQPQFHNVAYSGCGDARCSAEGSTGWYVYFKAEVAYTIPPPAPAPVPPPAPITHAYTNCFNKNCGSAAENEVVPGEQWEWLSIDMAKVVCDKHTTCGGFMFHKSPGTGWGAGMRPQWFSSNSCSGCGSSWANNWNSYLKGAELTVAATTPPPLVSPTPPSCQQTMNDYCASLNNGQCGTYARKPMGTATWTCFSSLHQTTTGLECVDDTGAETVRCAVGHVTASGCTPDLELSSIKAAAAICTQTPAPTPAPPTPPTPEPMIRDDPHVRNVNGESFDINRAGTFVLIQIPLAATSESSQLTVDATIEHGLVCTKVTWVKELQLQGSLLNSKYNFGTTDDVNAPFFMSVGNATTRSIEEFEHLALASEVTVEKMVSHVKKPGPRVTIHVGSAALQVNLVLLGPTTHDNHLDLNVKNMLSLVQSADLVGGLLGIDDHTFASEKHNEECNSRLMIETDVEPQSSVLTASM